jgi:lysophospholipid acyltransferase (LPLAT)-like uncharacterized protein
MTDTIERSLSWRRRALLVIVPPLVAALLRLLGATLRYESVFEDGGHADQPGEAAVWCFWHRCLLTAACYFRGRPRTTLLISASFDGELIARTIERLGYETVRGSSSRAGAAGLRALAGAVQQGATGVIPGDGPRGPRYLLKPGIAKLAHLTGRPVYTFYLLPQRAWVLRSWDALLVPRPFSRVVIVWGRPVPAPQTVEQEEFARLEAEQTLERLRALAQVHFGATTAPSK